jgi:hypothetical protein
MICEGGDAVARTQLLRGDSHCGIRITAPANGRRPRDQVPEKPVQAADVFRHVTIIEPEPVRLEQAGGLADQSRGPQRSARATVSRDAVMEMAVVEEIDRAVEGLGRQKPIGPTAHEAAADRNERGRFLLNASRHSGSPRSSSMRCNEPSIRS